MRFIVLFTAIFFLAAIPKAFACGCAPNDEQAAFNNAQFIGIARVESISLNYREPIPESDPDYERKMIERAITGSAYIYKFRPWQTLKGELSPETEVFGGGSNCDFPMPRVGGVYKILVTKGRGD